MGLWFQQMLWLSTLSRDEADAVEAAQPDPVIAQALEDLDIDAIANRLAELAAQRDS